MPAPFPCVFEKLEAVLLRHVVGCWWLDFSSRAKKTLRRVMLANVTLCALLPLNIWLLAYLAEMLLVPSAVLAFACLLTVVSGWVIVARTIEEGAIGMTGPVRTWLRELGTTAYADEDLALLAELSEALESIHWTRVSDLIRAAPPHLAETSLFRELRHIVEEIPEETMQRLRRIG